MNLAKVNPQSLINFLIGEGSIGRYGLIGLTGVALDLLCYSLLVRMGVLPITANLFSTFLGITNNFIWNSKLNFKTGLTCVRGIKFVTVGLLGLAFSTVLLSFFLYAGLQPFAAKWLAIPFVVSAQFITNRIWTFRK
jgi:putative flippase GtrA